MAKPRNNTESPGAENTGAAEDTPPPAPTVRVWSLIGAGTQDEVLGVQFLKHYVDVSPEVAEKLLARRQETRTDFTNEKGERDERIEEVPMYSSEKPAHLEAVGD